MGTLATRLVLLKPRDPESKGVVERRNGWFETSFMPGREFMSPADFNEQLTDWLTSANQRVVRTIRARPTDRLDKDRAVMLPLPPVPPVTGWRNQLRLGRDYYVRVASNDYSVDPTMIGRGAVDPGELKTTGTKRAYPRGPLETLERPLGPGRPLGAASLNTRRRRALARQAASRAARLC